MRKAMTLMVNKSGAKIRVFEDGDELVRALTQDGEKEKRTYPPCNLVITGAHVCLCACMCIGMYL